MYTFIQMRIKLNMIGIHQYLYYLYLFTVSMNIKVDLLHSDCFSLDI
jgi:hypothetical protein